MAFRERPTGGTTGRSNREPPPRERRGGDDRRERPRSGGNGPARKFVYEPYDQSKMRERATRSGGRFDSIFKTGFDSYRFKQGENVLRFLPATWGGPGHYGYDVSIHKYVGADNGNYLCLHKMKNQRCPICAAAKEARADRDDEQAKQLSSVDGVVAWVLDREGDRPDQPQLLQMSFTMDREISSIAEDRRTKAYLYIDHPDQGYDLALRRTGTGLNTRYFGYVLDRDPTPIAEKQRVQDDIMDYIQSNPVPSTLLFQTADYLDRVMAGGSDAPEEEEQQDDVVDRSRRDEPDDEIPFDGGSRTGRTTRATVRERLPSVEEEEQPVEDSVEEEPLMDDSGIDEDRRPPPRGGGQPRERMRR